MCGTFLDHGILAVGHGTLPLSRNEARPGRPGRSVKLVVLGFKVLALSSEQALMSVSASSPCLSPLMQTSPLFLLYKTGVLAVFLVAATFVTKLDRGVPAVGSCRVLLFSLSVARIWWLFGG